MTGYDRTGSVVILPTTDEQNRGDQALVWQTKAIAQQAGYGGDYYMLADPGAVTEQSQAHGISPLVPLLQHPGTRYKANGNIKYNVVLTLIWGVIAAFDSIKGLALLTSLGRRLLRPLLPQAERTTLDQIAASSACFVKGGGFIHSTASITDTYRAFFFLFHVLLAQSLGKDVFVMPNSFGPLEGRLYRWIVRRALERCRLVSARETISSEALHELGIEAPVFPDLAFGLGATTPSTPSPIAELKGRHPDWTIVGLTARPYRFPGAENPEASYESYLTEMKRFVGKLIEVGFQPVFIEHVMSDRDHESDIVAISRIVSSWPDGKIPVISVPDYNCAELKHLYGECDVVVGTRFHSVIFALAERTPALAIAYGGNKGLGIMRDAGLEEFVSPIEEFSAERAFSQLTDLVEREPEIEERLTALRARYSAEHDELARMVLTRR